MRRRNLSGGIIGPVARVAGLVNRITCLAAGPMYAHALRSTSIPCFATLAPLAALRGPLLKRENVSAQADHPACSGGAGIGSTRSPHRHGREGRRDVEPERVRGLEVDHQLSVSEGLRLWLRAGARFPRLSTARLRLLETVSRRRKQRPVREGRRPVRKHSGACARGQNAESRLEPDQWASPATSNRSTWRRCSLDCAGDRVG